METKAEENDYTELLRVHFPWYPTYRQILNEFNKIILHLVKAEIILQYGTLRYVEIMKFKKKYVVNIRCAYGIYSSYQGKPMSMAFNGAEEIEEAMSKNSFKINHFTRCASREALTSMQSRKRKQVVVKSYGSEFRSYMCSVPKEKLKLITEFADIWTEIVDTDEKSIELRQKLLQYLKDNIEN